MDFTNPLWISGVISESYNIYCVEVIIKFFLFVDHLENVALGKECRQSTTFRNSSVKYGPHLANDGERETYPQHGVCSNTEFDTDYFWWAVDLEVEFIIEIITIYGRTDCCSKAHVQYNKYKSMFYNLLIIYYQ